MIHFYMFIFKFILLVNILHIYTIYEIFTCATQTYNLLICTTLYYLLTSTLPMDNISTPWKIKIDQNTLTNWRTGFFRKIRYGNLLVTHSLHGTHLHIITILRRTQINLHTYIHWNYSHLPNIFIYLTNPLFSGQQQTDRIACHFIHKICKVPHFNPLPHRFHWTDKL